MNAHNRQFLIGNKPKKISDDWNTINIEKNFYLSHSSNITVGNSRDLNGKDWYLLGLAIQSEKERPDPLSEISSSTTENVKELYKSWVGRWVLVGNNEVHLDCSAILGCFYAKINDENWISSSLALLQEIGGLIPRPEELKWKSFFEWYPLPLTRFKGVYKLLPSQILNIETLQTKLRPLPHPIEGLSYQEILEKIAEKFKNTLLTVAKLNKRILLPLTAGYDSRLILGAVYYAGIKLETYSQEHPFISKSDVEFPFALAKMGGYHHTYVKMDESQFSQEKIDLYDYHTGRNVDDVDRVKFARGQWDSFGTGDLLLRGGIFEIGRCLYYSEMDADINVDTIIKKFGIVGKTDSFYYQAWSEWVDLVKQSPTEGLDWRDRFYLEQRVAGWMSSIEQSLDLTDSERFYLINSYDIISLFLSIPVEKRRTYAHHVDLIRIMFPASLKYPFNPPDSILKSIRNKVVKISKMPLSQIYKKLRKKVLHT